MHRALGIALVVAGAAAVAPAALAQPTGVLAGRIVDSAGAPLAGATVVLVGTTARATSSASGAFALLRAPAGARMLRATRLGHTPGHLAVEIVAGERREVSIVLAVAPRTLDSVAVVARGGKPERYANTTRLDEFFRRRDRGFGRFVTRDEIERMSVTHATDLLRDIPGVHVKRTFSDLTLRFARCGQFDERKPAPGPNVGVSRILNADRALDGETKIVFFLNGVRVGLETFLEMSSEDVEAMEVYRGVSELPAEARGYGCAAIFVWTRQ